MKFKWKMALMAGFLLTPIAGAHANDSGIIGGIVEQPNPGEGIPGEVSYDENRAILYFSRLDMTSSTIDASILQDLLNKAFPNENDPKRMLLQGKFNYIQHYKSLGLMADSLKIEIPKLVVTSKTIYPDVTATITKYNTLSSTLFTMNETLYSLTRAVSDPAYDQVLTNIAAYYENQRYTSNGIEYTTLTDILARMIGASNQNTLLARSIQVQNVFEKQHVDGKTYVQLVSDLKNVNGSSINLQTYEALIEKVETAYQTFTLDEKKMADSQIEAVSKLTFKQVLSDAKTNISKAAAFDVAIRQFTQLNTNPDTEAGINELKAQLQVIDKSYGTLTELQKKLLSDASLAVIEPFQYVLNIGSKIGALKIIGAQQYRDDLAVIETMLLNLAHELRSTSISAEIAYLIIPNIAKYELALEEVANATIVENGIDTLKVEVLTDQTVKLPTSAEISMGREAFNKLSVNERKLVRNLSALMAWENAEKRAALVDKKIDAIAISTKADFYKKFADAFAAYELLNKNIEVFYMKKEQRLLSLAYYAQFINAYNAISLNDPAYTSKIEQLLSQIGMTINSGEVAYENAWRDETFLALQGVLPSDVDQLKSIRSSLLDRRDSTQIAEDLIRSIDHLPSVATHQLISTLIEYREIFNSLDTQAKKLVSNIKKLAEYEKNHLDAIKFVNAVESLDPLAKDFTKKALSARTAYNKLNSNLKPLVNGTEILLKRYESLSNVLIEIEQLSKSKNILEDATKANENYNALVEELTSTTVYPFVTIKGQVLAILNSNYKTLLDLALMRDAQVNELIQAITAVQSNATQTVSNAIEQISIKYKALSSNDKKLVLNYDVFKIIDKDFKAGQKVELLIENLPSQEATDYSKKIEQALIAYRKLTDTQKKYVFNYRVKLEPFITVAALIGDIDSLKTNDKEFNLKVAQLRERYNQLNAMEKAQVHNYNKLVSFENVALGVSHVITLIQEAKPGIENYLLALQEARDAYNMLSKDQQKQVVNYKQLQEREAAVKPVLTLDLLIESINNQRAAKNFISNYDKAWKSYETISLQNRKLLTNEQLLIEQYPPLYEVMLQIESISASSKTFTDDVAKARGAYERLTVEQQARILNVALLQQHEVNVLGGKHVDDLIRALQSNPKEIYVEKVLEAVEAYKNLSSDNKKAVSLYNVLKVEEAYIKPVVQVIELIDILSVSSNNVDKQVKKIQSVMVKLSDEQLRLIHNLDKYNALGSVINTINLIEMIKPSDTKYYIGNTRAAEIVYNQLSPDEKARVSNYTKLEEALLNVQALNEIITKINELSYISDTFSSDVSRLLIDYKKLPSALKKQVSNYAVLVKASDDIKIATKLTDAITKIDPSLRTFRDAVVKARAEYNKLSENQKLLIFNLRILTNYERQLGL